MPSDMLVKLYSLSAKPELDGELQKQGIQIKRAMPADKSHVVLFVKNNFNGVWAQECSYTFSAHPVTCMIAVAERHVVGFACYDAAAKNFFGPVGVHEKWRGRGVGEALLRACLRCMKEDGYGYAVIGWVDGAEDFYRRTVQATVIEDSFPGVYRDLIDIEDERQG